MRPRSGSITRFNLARRHLGYPYWSLSAYLKFKVKNAVQFIGEYATAVSDEARKRNVAGVVCGHIHHAEIKDIDGVLYCNDGDWVESCTALVEHFDGSLEIVRWMDVRRIRRAGDRPALPVRGRGGGRLRIVLTTDAWAPQVNGVVRTLNELRKQLTRLGHAVTVIHPGLFATLHLIPGYREIRLAIGTGRSGGMIEGARPDAVHIATEGPVGHAARRFCLKRNIGFTTAYHTRFPEYLAARRIAPASLTYTLLRRFHAPSRGVFDGDAVDRRVLARARLRQSAAVDARGRSRALRSGAAPRGPWISAAHLPRRRAGRAGKESRARLPRARFAGLEAGGGGRRGRCPGRAEAPLPRRAFPGPCSVNGELGHATHASSDVFVFPSRTDTFGLVMLEALASGLPVAAYPVPGPNDVIGASGAGVLDEDLRAAALAALAIPRAHCRKVALTFDWGQLRAPLPRVRSCAGSISIATAGSAAPRRWRRTAALARVAVELNRFASAGPAMRTSRAGTNADISARAQPSRRQRGSVANHIETAAPREERNLEHGLGKPLRPTRYHEPAAVKAAVGDDRRCGGVNRRRRSSSTSVGAGAMAADKAAIALATPHRPPCR